MTITRDAGFDGAIGKVRLGRKVVETLGWRWVATRLFLAAERRSGSLARRTPVTRWSDWQLQGTPRLQDVPLHPASAGRFLGDHHPEVEIELRNRLEQLKARQFDLFGTLATVTSWHEEPLSPASYPSGPHWSKIRELPDADLKLIWEPSRFSWVYDLCRLHALDPETAAPDVFWSLFEDWCEQNQPNAGVNWRCGQEAALRLMAVLFGVFTFGSDHLDDERRHLLACFADATAKRILAHWRYAASQDNNHIVSEAVGLLTVGLVFPGLRVSERARTTGGELLDAACRRLVFPDGGTSQYSLNYHRVFMDNFVWALWLCRSVGADPPTELEPALRRTHDFLAAVTQKRDGAAGNWGHDDKAQLLPLAATGRLDVRPTLAMAAQALDGTTHRWAGPGEEAVRWFWGEPTYRPDEPEPEGVETTIFPDAGLSVIVSGSNRAVIRGGGRQRFRPPQCDFGHVELWIDGEQVVVDPGTSSYKPKPGEPDYAETQWHNLPWPEGEQQMTRLGRFLWGDWPTVDVGPSPDGLRVTVRSGSSSASRQITATSSGWMVTDIASDGARCHWCGEPVGDGHCHRWGRGRTPSPFASVGRRGRSAPSRVGVADA